MVSMSVWLFCQRVRNGWLILAVQDDGVLQLLNNAAVFFNHQKNNMLNVSALSAFHHCFDTSLTCCQ